MLPSILRKLSLSALSFLIFISTSYANTPLNLAQQAPGGISVLKEQEMGKEFMAMVAKQLPIISDPITETYIQSLGQSLIAASPAKLERVYFFVINSSSINAFAGPGGYIGVNSGLITKAGNESELAAVLAHELAHVSQRHIIRSIEYSKQMRIPTIAAMAAAIAVSIAAPGVGAGAMAGITAGRMQGMINHTRAHEKEADRIGIHTLVKAGYDPKAMPAFFKRLAEQERLFPNDVPEYLRTHPFSQSRMADIDNRIKSLPEKHINPRLNFALIQARLAALTSPNPLTIASTFKREVKKTTGIQQQANRYGLALALLRLNHYNQANHQISLLQQKDPDNSIYTMLKAKYLVAKRQDNKALKLLKANYEINPDYYPVSFAYGKTLVLAGKNKQASRFFSEELQNYPDKPIVYFYLAKAQAQSGENSASHQTIARLLKLMDNKKAEKRQLELALKAPGNDRYTLMKLNARIKQLNAQI